MRSRISTAKRGAVAAAASDGALETGGGASIQPIGARTEVKARVREVSRCILSSSA